MSLQEKLHSTSPKNMLSIEGGGIRGILELEVLKKIETLLAQGNADFRLCDHFDYISGTSTGAIIATGLSLGMSVDDLLAFYVDDGEAMFDKASLLKRFHRYRYEDENLSGLLKAVFGADTTLGTDKLKTLLMVVLRNATTDSPWLLSNNPYALYNDRNRGDCNLDLPLWQIVRASTAAPTFFPPERMEIGHQEFLFVDGGVTPYNNPAFMMYQMATMNAYWPLLDKSAEPTISWPAKPGANNLTLVSLGSGFAANENAELAVNDMHLIYNASKIPAALMYAAESQQDLLCRSFGDCVFGHVLERELGHLIGDAGAGAVPDKLFRYLRYTPDLSGAGLSALGLSDIEPATVQSMDSIDGMGKMREVGRALAERDVKDWHFGL